MKTIMRKMLAIAEAIHLPVSVTYRLFIAYCRRDGRSMNAEIDRRRSKVHGTVAEREAFRS